jgi:hypothetical protein
MIQKIDTHKLNIVRDPARTFANPEMLRREGKVFFIGGNLPVYSTLETMYESYCLESSELFHVTFGAADKFEHNLEMVRQIKRNFSIRLMGFIGYPMSESQVERVYLAGLDMLDIPHGAYDSLNGAEAGAGSVKDTWETALRAASATFPRWSVVSTIIAGRSTLQDSRDSIKELLGNGVIPLIKFAEINTVWSDEEAGSLFSFLAVEWHKHRVPLKPVMPLLRVTTPFVFAEPSGFLREVYDKLQDRRILAASDIRRHLRTSGAVASFESAGL